MRLPERTRVDCLEGLPYTGRLGFESDHCPSTTPCRIRVQNLEVSGTVKVRMLNPYGASVVLALVATFPSAVLAETETFFLPSTIAKDPATVTGTPDVSDYMGEATPSCPGTYLVWRGLTFSDPSGRVTLALTQKAMAERLGVDPTTLARLERGKRFENHGRKLFGSRGASFVSNFNSSVVRSSL